MYSLSNSVGVISNFPRSWSLEGFLIEIVWIRDRTVGKIFCGFSIVKIIIVSSGGSSKSLSKLFWASGVIRSAFSIITKRLRSFLPIVFSFTNSWIVWIWSIFIEILFSVTINLQYWLFSNCRVGSPAILLISHWASVVLPIPLLPMSPNEFGGATITSWSSLAVDGCIIGCGIGFVIFMHSSDL